MFEVNRARKYPTLRRQHCDLVMNLPWRISLKSKENRKAVG